MYILDYIGLDVHKRKISCRVKDSGGKIYAEGSPPPHALSHRSRLFRELSAGLLRHHVRGIPGGPAVVFARPVEQVRPPCALLVLDVGSLRTEERILEIIRRSERRLRGIDPTWGPLSDFLDEP